MLKKKIWIILFSILMAMLFISTGCSGNSTTAPGNGDDDNGEDVPTVTLSVNRVNSTTFTLTVDGATWRSGINPWSNAELPDRILDGFGSGIRLSDNTSVNLGASSFDWVRTNDTTLTLVLRDGFRIINLTLFIRETNNMAFDFIYRDGWVNIVAHPTQNRVTFP
jgi:hypothetical protein